VLELRTQTQQQDEALKLKQKIKNFKLKFSRLLTCYATIAYLSSFDGDLTRSTLWN
jgi:hypothetical protein